MYEHHFGLHGPLFPGGIASDAAVFLGGRRAAVVEHVEIASTTPDAVLVLHGPAGLGKTTLAAHALRAHGTRLAIGWLAAAPQTPHELLELLLSEFGFETYRFSRAERLHVWRQYLRELAATETRVAIGVENADSLPAGVLAALEALTRADPNGAAGARLLLMGGTALFTLLEHAALENLCQRVRLRQVVAPFTEEDTEAYLRQAVELAGGRFDSIFAPGAAAGVHGWSAGVARVANNLCESALPLAARRRTLVTPELVAFTAVELCGLPARAKAPTATGQQNAARSAAPAALDIEGAETTVLSASPIAQDRPEAEGIPTLTESDSAEDERVGEPWSNDDFESLSAALASALFEEGSDEDRDDEAAAADSELAVADSEPAAADAERAAVTALSRR